MNMKKINLGKPARMTSEITRSKTTKKAQECPSVRGYTAEEAAKLSDMEKMEVRMWNSGHLIGKPSEA